MLVRMALSSVLLAVPFCLWSPQAAGQGVKARGATVKSDRVAESVIAAARKHKAGLIVMASHGRKGIQRLLLGSETQHVLTHSSVPVLVLR